MKRLQPLRCGGVAKTIITPLKKEPTIPLECSVHERKNSLVLGPRGEVDEGLEETLSLELTIAARRIESVEGAGG